MGNYHSGDEKWIIDEFEQKRAKRGTNYIVSLIKKKIINNNVSLFDIKQLFIVSCLFRS